MNFVNFGDFSICCVFVVFLLWNFDNSGKFGKFWNFDILLFGYCVFVRTCTQFMNLVCFVDFPFGFLRTL